MPHLLNKSNRLNKVITYLEFLSEGSKDSIEYLTKHLIQDKFPPNEPIGYPFSEYDLDDLGSRIADADQESISKVLELVRKGVQMRLEALRSGDFELYLFRFGGHSRYLAFRHVCMDLSSEQYWRLLKYVWTCSEYTFDNRHSWLGYWRRANSDQTVKTRDRLNLMDEDELTVYKNLPKIITAYRGVAFKDDVLSLSWTLDRNVAAFFARRHQNHGGDEPLHIATLQIDKKDVFAYINDRSEHELVVDFQRLNENAIQWELYDEASSNEFSDANSKAYSDAA